MGNAAAGASHSADAASRGSSGAQQAGTVGDSELEPDVAVDQKPQQRPQQLLVGPRPTGVQHRPLAALQSVTGASSATAALRQPAVPPVLVPSGSEAHARDRQPVQPAAGVSAHDALLDLLTGRARSAAAAAAMPASPAAAAAAAALSAPMPSTSAPLLPVKPRGAHRRKRAPQRSEPGGTLQSGGIASSSSGEDAVRGSARRWLHA